MSEVTEATVEFSSNQLSSSKIQALPLCLVHRWMTKAPQDALPSVGPWPQPHAAVWIPQELAVVEDKPELGSIPRERTVLVS